ncbi:glycosyltransferase family 4 protein [Hymenobacter sp. B1770]|uniref:glycosyltransferase family 4 protein n=1 Tax=Hymenobacter sp. B1770 TaxID=1718788 RepID=UPI003CEDB5B0
MRIAFVSLMYDAPWGGSEVLWSQTAARALAAGHNVFISTHEWHEKPVPLQELEAAGASFYFRPRYQPTLRFRTANLFRRLPRGGVLPEIVALRSFAPNVVVVSQGGWNDLLFHQQLADWLHSIPFLLICHNYHDPVRQDDKQRERMIALFSRAKEVLMISNQQLRVLCRQLAAPLTNARVVQNPLNLPAAYPLPYPELLADTVPQLSVVGSFDVDRKGQDVLLETLATPTWQGRHWHLNLYGRGPDQAYLERLISMYGLQRRVSLHGHVSDSSVIWRNTHLLILPSRIESGPMVVQEALLCGRPVLTANVGLVQDWVQEGETGFIADTASVIALGQALDRAWARRADWASMGQEGAARATALLIPDPAGDFLQHVQASV